jgi:hypothetical protein
MEVGGALRAQKKFDFKPACSPRPQSRGHRQGHIKRAYQEKELMPDTLRFHRRVKGKVVGAIKPTTRS